jgi:methyltransferase (TIGR00027 family)
VSAGPRRRALGAIATALVASAATPRIGRAQSAARDAATPMETGRPSATAFGAAALRAAHQLLDAPPAFEDPLALRILGPRVAAAIVEDPQRAGAPASLRALVSLRSRHAEQALADAVGRGVRQYVVLGAGLDTFAYRNPFGARGLRVFEVDHPATQRWKRERLAEAGIEVPVRASFAPVDFERDTLADGLARAGFDADAPAFFSLLGVTV